MAKETKYGVISDVHNDPRVVPLAIDVLRKEGAEKLLINGDIGERQEKLEDTQQYTAFILDSIGKSGLESFVQPGGHETLLGFQPVLDHFGDKYDNLFTVSNPLKFEGQGHDLVFLPGSDFICGGEYVLSNNEQIPSGRYVQTKERLCSFEDLGQYVDALQKGIAQGAMQYANMAEIKDLVTNPERTISVCHVPRKFNNVNDSVDMVEFGEAVQNFQLKDGQIIKKGAIFPVETAKRLHQEGYAVQVQLKNENRGNQDLANLYEELGVTKGISGHFHESGHRANDRKGNHLEEGLFSDELFWNSGHLDTGQTGILTVKDNQAKYQNIRLQDYM